MNTRSIVVGVDGGGTYTRAMAANVQGQALAWAQTGGANPSKNDDAEHNVRAAISQVILDSGRIASDVVGLVAGISGLDEPTDLAWAELFCTVPGLLIKPTCVNDAKVAWAGAHALRPGIVVIVGTGCIVFGVTETGREVRNYDFAHYAEAHARGLTFDAVFRIIAGEVAPADNELIAALLEHFGVADVRALSESAAANDSRDRQSLMRQYGSAAPLITDAADKGVPLAVNVCERAVVELARGVRLIGSMFATKTVAYSLTGGVARSRYVQRRLAAVLSNPANKQYTLTEPALPPEAGAALMALQSLGGPVDPGSASISKSVFNLDSSLRHLPAFIRASASIQ